MGSSIRRRASAYVQYTSASQITTRNRISRSTARFTPLLLIPKTAGENIKDVSVVVVVPRTSVALAPRTGRCLEEYSAEQVPDPKENQDHDRDDEGYQPYHRQEAGSILVVCHKTETRRWPGWRRRSPTR